MSRELNRRAEETKTFNRMKERVPGSGYHDDDKDWRGTPCAPQRRGLPRISEHLVPFYDEFEVHFVGEDAERALVALGAWHDAHATTDFKVYSKYSGTQRSLLNLIPSLVIREVEGVPRLTLWITSWNDYLVAFHAQGIGLSGEPFHIPVANPVEAPTHVVAGL